VTARDCRRARRHKALRREVAALRKLLEARHVASAEPVGLAEAARLAGVSSSTMYQHAREYGGWKVDPSKPKSEWRFDPDRLRQIRDAQAVTPVALDAQRRPCRATGAPLLPVKDRRHDFQHR
jgi:hypothetical protein